MARIRSYYDEGTPQARFMDAVDRRYPHRLESLFEKVAERLNITRDSASGAFYGFLAGRRPLPTAHRDLYRELTGVSDELFSEIDALRGPSETPRRRDRLEELVTTVGDLLEWQTATKKELSDLRRRLKKLEAQPVAAASAPKRPRRQAAER